MKGYMIQSWCEKFSSFTGHYRVLWPMTMLVQFIIVSQYVLNTQLCFGNSHSNTKVMWCNMITSTLKFWIDNMTINKNSFGLFATRKVYTILPVRIIRQNKTVCWSQGRYPPCFLLLPSTWQTTGSSFQLITQLCRFMILNMVCKV